MLEMRKCRRVPVVLYRYALMHLAEVKLAEAKIQTKPAIENPLKLCGLSAPVRVIVKMAAFPDLSVSCLCLVC